MRPNRCPRALAAGIDLGSDETEAASLPLNVLGNAMLIGEALINLVDNAIRYAGRGASVTVGVRAEQATAVLFVEDSGPGVAEIDRERVFQRFARATHDGNGAGLGLAIVREIVERSSGTVTLEAVEPHGLRVVVRLPLAA